MILSGLAAVNPLIRSYAAPIATTQPAVSTGASPGFSITQHHFLQIYDEAYPGVRDGKASEYSARYREQVAALATSLPPCPEEARTDGGTQCYNAFYAPLSTPSGNGPELLAPGTFEVYGVPFTPAELSNGKLVRTLKPTPEQRKRLELTVIRGSLEHLFGDPNSVMNPIRRPLVGSGAIRKVLLGRGIMNPESFAAEASVDTMIAVAPFIKLYALNFVRNPLQPTPAQRTQPGGWKSWIESGGYPLSDGVIHGKTRVDGARPLQFCASILCACPNAALTGGAAAPSCKPGVLKVDGRVANFYPYVSVYQDLANPYFSVTLVYDEPAWITKVGEAAAGVMQKLAGLTCANAGMAQAQMAAMLETYRTADGRSCAKGSAGCFKVQPSATTTGSVSLFNAYMSRWCAEWAKEYAPKLPLPAPEPLPPPDQQHELPEKEGLTRGQWIALGLAGLAVGAMFTKRRR